MIRQNTIQTYMTGIVMLIVLFLLLAELLPEAQDAGDNLSATGVPLGGLFAGGGLVFLLIMAGLLIFIVKAVTPKK